MICSATISDVELATAVYRLGVWESHGIPHGNDNTVIPDPDPLPHPDYTYKIEYLPDMRATRISWKLNTPTT
jgi:hypothetical protein